MFNILTCVVNIFFNILPQSIKIYIFFRFFPLLVTIVWVPVAENDSSLSCNYFYSVMGKGIQDETLMLCLDIVLNNNTCFMKHFIRMKLDPI